MTTLTLNQLRSKVTTDPYIHLASEANPRYLITILEALYDAQSFSGSGSPIYPWIEQHKTFTTARLQELAVNNDCMGNQWQDAPAAPELAYIDSDQLEVNPLYVSE